MKKIAIFVGSLRKGSYAKAIAQWVVANAPEKLTFEIVEIGQLPLYNQDYDGADPDVYTVFREKVKAFDGFLFVTPEHNRSFPAALKNALDVASRPWGQSVWGGKPGAVISHSIGGLSGFGANQHLRQVLTFLDIYTMAQPECYVGNAAANIDEAGTLNDNLAGFLTSFLNAFKAWVEKF